MTFSRGGALAPPFEERAAMRIGNWSTVRDAARFAVLPVVVIAGFSAWIMLPELSDADEQAAPVPSAANGSVQNAAWQNTAWVEPANGPTQSTSPGSTEDDLPADTAQPAAVTAAPEIAVPETTAPATSPLDGLKISAQSWRRGGLGSKALVTLTLRNRNDFAVRDVEIACAFSCRDGSYLTDRNA